MVAEPKLEDFVKRILNVYNIEKYIAAKKTQQNTYSNKNSLLRMLIVTLRYNEVLYSPHVKYNILWINIII